MDKNKLEHNNVATTLALAARHRHAKRTQGENKLLQGNLLTLLYVLYVDNDAAPFEYCLQLESGLSLIHNHFIMFGLEMHIGQGRKSSKTECIFFHHKVV